MKKTDDDKRIGLKMTNDNWYCILIFEDGSWYENRKSEENYTSEICREEIITIELRVMQTNDFTIEFLFNQIM